MKDRTTPKQSPKGVKMKEDITQLSLKKKDIERLEQELEVAITSTARSPDRQAKEIRDLEAKISKAQTQRLRLEAEDEKAKVKANLETWRENLPVSVLQFIIENNIYYLEYGNGFWLGSNGIFGSDNLKVSNRDQHWPELFSSEADPKGEFYRAVQLQLKQMGRIYFYVTQSFGYAPKNTLNLMRNAKSAFVQPIDDGEPVHPLIIAIFNSLGAHKAENVKHLQEVIYHKWLVPESYTLPALIISGEGGTGKNVLVDSFLPTLFGGKHTTATISDLSADFNDELEAKVAILVDEGSQSFGKAKSDSIKSIIGNPNLNINKKFGLKYTASNTAMYIITSNGKAGVWLGNDSSDRRYSIHYVEKNRQNTLFDVIAKDILKLSYDGEIGPKNIENKDILIEVQSYWDENKFVLEDPQEVGRWLHHYSLVASKHAPSALHGADYRDLIDNQMSPKESFFRNVLLSPNFDAISKAELWKWWQHHTVGEPSGKKKYFNIDLEAFCEEHTEVALGQKNTKAHKNAVNHSNIAVVYNATRNGNAIPHIDHDDHQDEYGDYFNPEDFALVQETENVVQMPDRISPAEQKQRIHEILGLNVVMK